MIQHVYVTSLGVKSRSSSRLPSIECLYNTATTKLKRKEKLPYTFLLRVLSVQEASIKKFHRSCRYRELSLTKKFVLIQRLFDCVTQVFVHLHDLVHKIRLHGPASCWQERTSLSFDMKFCSASLASCPPPPNWGSGRT